jgi:hypothetical protein
MLKVLIDDGVLEEVVPGCYDNEGLGGDFDPVGAFEGEGFGAVCSYAQSQRGEK